MGAREISNRGRDYKLVQNNPKSRFENSIMQLLSGCSWNKYIQKSMVNGKFFILSKFRLLQLLGMSWQRHYLFLLFICFLSNNILERKLTSYTLSKAMVAQLGKKSQVVLTRNDRVPVLIYASQYLVELLMLLTLMYMKKVLVDANTLFLVTGFTQKIPESLDSIYSLNFS